MKRSIHILCLIAGLALISSCCNDSGAANPTTPSADYLIFGHYYGMCAGEECVEIFKLEKTELLEDTTDIYPSIATFYQGGYRVLPNSKFEKISDLINFFPQELLNQSSGKIGYPDAGDWGGLYVEYNYNGIRKFWLIDRMKYNIPEYLHEFTDKINDKISIINNTD